MTQKITSFFSVLLLAFVVYWSFSAMLPSEEYINTTDPNSFSMDAALGHLKKISAQPHYVGSPAHKEVQNYIVAELKKMNLAPEIQVQTAVNKKWGAATTTENILVRIQGTAPGKALLLLSHYDSAPHSSLGASDAGSGVVTILEGLRSFLAQNTEFKNDIIVLISDAEELGLLGAKAFVAAHPWAKDVGLVLNFEARGSGGASYMLLETNGKNSRLIAEFIKANPTYPAANSLMYSIYKMLPNDTDLTVFREEAGINGFNFAFIDDHFDYHTAQDSYERLDRSTLQHQADYFTTLVPYFANISLENLDSTQDNVYVNFPGLTLLSYPFSWNFWLLLLAVLGLLLLFVFGFKTERLTKKGILLGFIPFVSAVIGIPLLVFFAVKILGQIHPQYQDILHGFPYNGYRYLVAFIALSCWLLWRLYLPFFIKTTLPNLLIAPMVVWLLINAFLVSYLPGAGFFIIPVFGVLAVLFVLLYREKERVAHIFLFAVCAIPMVYIFAPQIAMFPVGLGLKNTWISSLFCVLIFGFLLPVFSDQASRKFLSKRTGLLVVILFVFATFHRNYNEDRKSPNSLVYVQNQEDRTAYFATYNKTMDAFTSQIFGETPIQKVTKTTVERSKYNTRFTYQKETKYRAISQASITVVKDSLVGDDRQFIVRITPQRKIHKLALFSASEITLQNFLINGVPMSDTLETHIDKGSFLNYQFGNTDAFLELSFSIAKNELPLFQLQEITYDLLKNPLFQLQPRTSEMMPMPFVTNDATICVQKINL